MVGTTLKQLIIFLSITGGSINMKLKSKVKPASLLIPFIAVCGIVLSSGCIHLKGNDDHYEFIASPEMLRQIEPIELNEAEEEDEVYTPDRGEPELSEFEISLEECRALALENNLDLKVQLISPTMAAENVTQEEARFDATFSAGTTYTKINAPVATTLEIAGAKRDTTTSDFGFEIPLRTGGTINIDGTDIRKKTDSEYSIFNPSYESSLSASISQPLLRDAGKRASTYRIRLQEYERQITDTQTKAAVIKLIADVEKAYWQLYAERRKLIVYKQQYELAKDLFEETQRLVEIGMTPEIELYRTRSGVHDSINTIISIENNVRNYERSLKRILNKPGLGLETKTVLIPTTEPDPVHYEINREQMTANAIENRMDMLEQELRIAQGSSSIDYYRNQTLPQIDIDYEYEMNGLGKGRSDSYDVLFDNNFHTHTVGLDFAFSLRNRVARSMLRNGIYQRTQQLVSRDIKKDQIKDEVLSQIDQLEASWQHILASRQSTIYRDQQYKAEKRLYELGMNTSRDVLLAQSYLTNAQSSEITALTQYQNALVELAKATGTLLGAAKVQWEPFVPEN
jgi:outer membrane protein